MEQRKFRGECKVDNKQIVAELVVNMRNMKEWLKYMTVVLNDYISKVEEIENDLNKEG